MKVLSHLKLTQLKKRGLSDLVEKWIGLVRQGQPDIRNPQIASKGQEVYSIVYSAVDGYFRTKIKNFDGDYILTLLKELKSLPDQELQLYISKVEEFIVELNRVAISQDRLN